MAAKDNKGQSEVTIWEQPHGGNLLRFMVREYKGKRFAELRSWYRDGDGWKHGSKGCTMPLEHLDALADALRPMPAGRRLSALKWNGKGGA